MVNQVLDSGQSAGVIKLSGDSAALRQLMTSLPNGAVLQATVTHTAASSTIIFNNQVIELSANNSANLQQLTSGSTLYLTKTNVDDQSSLQAYAQVEAGRQVIQLVNQSQQPNLLQKLAQAMVNHAISTIPAQTDSAKVLNWQANISHQGKLPVLSTPDGQQPVLLPKPLLPRLATGEIMASIEKANNQLLVNLQTPGMRPVKVNSDELDLFKLLQQVKQVKPESAAQLITRALVVSQGDNKQLQISQNMNRLTLPTATTVTTGQVVFLKLQSDSAIAIQSSQVKQPLATIALNHAVGQTAQAKLSSAATNSQATTAVPPAIQTIVYDKKMQLTTSDGKLPVTGNMPAAKSTAPSPLPAINLSAESAAPKTVKPQTSTPMELSQSGVKLTVSFDTTSVKTPVSPVKLADNVFFKPTPAALAQASIILQQATEKFAGQTLPLQQQQAWNGLQQLSSQLGQQQQGAAEIFTVVKSVLNQLPAADKAQLAQQFEQAVSQQLTQPTATSFVPVISKTSVLGSIGSALALLVGAQHLASAASANQTSQLTAQSLTPFLVQFGLIANKQQGEQQVKQLLTRMGQHELVGRATQQLGQLVESFQFTRAALAEQLSQPNQAFYMVLPVQVEGQAKTVEFVIEQEKNDNNNDKTKTWLLTLKLAVGELGTLLTKAQLNEQQLSLNFIADNADLAKTTEQHLSRLREKFDGLGFKTEQVNCKLGVVPETIKPVAIKGIYV